MNELAARENMMPSQQEWNHLREQATIAVRSGLLPKDVNTPEKAIVIALKGRELGIPVMQAYSHIHIIQGKPSVSSELMLSLIYRNCKGAVIDYLESTEQRCVVLAKRPGHKPAQFSFSIEEAKKAGLLSKSSWSQYPAAMLRARVIAIAARAVFPDAIMGCSYTPEELGAEVDDEGVVDVEPIHTAEPEKKEARSPEEKRKRDQLSTRLMKVYKPFLEAFPKTDFPALLEQRYGKRMDGEPMRTVYLSVEELQDCVEYMEGRLVEAQLEPGSAG